MRAMKLELGLQTVEFFHGGGCADWAADVALAPGEVARGDIPVWDMSGLLIAGDGFCVGGRGDGCATSGDGGVIVIVVLLRGAAGLVVAVVQVVGGRITTGRDLAPHDRV